MALTARQAARQITRDTVAAILGPVLTLVGIIVIMGSLAFVIAHFVVKYW